MTQGKHHGKKENTVQKRSNPTKPITSLVLAMGAATTPTTNVATTLLKLGAFFAICVVRVEGGEECITLDGLVECPLDPSLARNLPVTLWDEEMFYEEDEKLMFYDPLNI
jgi:hypothetical protein